MPSRIGLIFIGQTPREDIVGDMRRYLSEQELEIVQYGALDLLSDRQLALLEPLSEHILITKLRDGSSVTLDEAQAQRLAAEALLRSEADGCRLCAIMCTGQFPELSCSIPVITSDDAFHHSISFPDAVRTIGVLVPLESQMAAFSQQYAHYNRKIVSDCASPYGPMQDILGAARRLKAAGADCICLDCMGYDELIADNVSGVVDLPVYTPRRQVARLICQYFKDNLENQTCWEGQFL